MTQENDIVLIYFEDKPMIFARVEHITADHKKDWFQVTLLMLAIPLQTITWILREEYINGAEFTMDGKKVRMEKVESPAITDARPSEDEPGDEPPGDETSGQDSESAGEKGSARVITFPGLPEDK
ncbi:MAG: hypothetical protein SWH61_11705 [Thermodesulfobacteriota bacterium]|nr:hypothetical protein [Thermodesulfobacteriota bacterium]